jgi:hypothetical protein
MKVKHFWEVCGMSLLKPTEWAQTIKLHTPCYGFMKIVQLYNKQVDSKHTPIKVTEVCSNGLNFVSLLHLPIYENMVCSFQIKIWDEEEQCEGVIISRSRIKSGYEYKAKLSKVLAQPNSGLTKALHQYAYFNEESNSKLIDLLC